MNPDQLARLAGSIYLVQFFSGSFPLYVRSRLVAPGDAAATAANVLGSETLYRLSMLSEVVVSLTWLSIAFTLFILLKQVRRELASLFLILTIVGVAAINVNVVFLSGALALFEGGAYSASFEPGQLQALGLLLLSLFDKGWMVAGLFTGLWLLPLGYVVRQSAYLPKVFGVFLMLGCFGYVIPVVASYVAPEVHWIRRLDIVSGVAEISFGLWLLLKGAATPARA